MRYMIYDVSYIVNVINLPVRYTQIENIYSNFIILETYFDDLLTIQCIENEYLFNFIILETYFEANLLTIQCLENVFM